MARVIGGVVAVVALLVPQFSAAQQAQQLFDFFLNQANQELQRQQQRDLERTQRQQLNQLNQQFLTQWHACHNDEIEACVQALTYPYLAPVDRQSLLTKRSEIVAAQDAAAARARQERINAEIAAQKLQREREELAERQRVQAVEQERARQREQEVAAARKRELALEEERSKQREQEAMAAQRRHKELTDQRAEADRLRERAEAAEKERAAAVAQLNLLRFQQTVDLDKVKMAQDWSLSTPVTVFAALALVLGAMVVFRDQLQLTASRAIGFVQRFKPPQVSLSALWTRFTRYLQAWSAKMSRPAASPDIKSPAVAQPATPDSPPPIRDTPGAIAALELAHAFIDEVRQAEAPGFEDNELRAQQLNTLSLASKQIDVAQRLDPDAVLEGQNEAGVPYRYSVTQLKALALFIEGVTHHAYDLRRAIPALVLSTQLDPSNPAAFFLLGTTHAANMNKAEAVTALERAVALNPKNLSYRKELDRAQNLTQSEILTYKATRAGERVYDAGIATANVGIRIYNVFAICWNSFAFVWNIFTFPLRLMFRIGGLK